MRVIEVFCGAGGMSFGLKRAGFQIDLGIDSWLEALGVYRRNLKSPFLLARGTGHTLRTDLSNLLTVVPAALLRKCDMVAGGPPCQDFSSAGSRIEGTRADLTLAYAIFVATIHPRWVLMENVPGARSSMAYARARTILKRSGYGLTEKVLDMSLYGVPQARERFIVIGRLGEADGFLESALEAAASVRPTTVRDILGDEVGVHPGGNHPPETRVYFLRPYKGYSGVRSIDAPCPTITSKSDGRASKNQPQHEDDLAPPQQVPALNWDQLSLIQGFPRNWDWEPAGTKGARATMTANAVPAPFAEAIGRVILDREHGRSIPDIEPSFVKWLTRSKKFKGASLRNRKSYLNRARIFLKGRILTDIDAEIALLEKNEQFAVLSPSVKSDLRLSLRLHAEWREFLRRKDLRRMAKAKENDFDNDYEKEEENLAAPTLRIGPKKAA